MRVVPPRLEPSAGEPCPGRRSEAGLSLYDHLRNALSAQRLAANKGLALDAGKKVGHSSQSKEHSSGNQARGGAISQAQPLDQGHDGVGTSAHVVGLDFPDVGIERAGGRADSEQQRYLDKQDDEGRHYGNDAHDAVPDTQSESRSDDVGQSQRKAEDHGQDAQPLAVDTEVSCGELILETHLGGYYDRLAAAEHRNAICGLGGDEDMLTATAATRATRGSAMEAHASGRGS